MPNCITYDSTESFHFRAARPNLSVFQRTDRSLGHRPRMTVVYCCSTVVAFVVAVQSDSAFGCAGVVVAANSSGVAVEDLRD